MIFLSFSQKVNVRGSVEFRSFFYFLGSRADVHVGEILIFSEFLEN